MFPFGGTKFHPWRFNSGKYFHIEVDPVLEVDMARRRHFTAEDPQSDWLIEK